MLKLLAGIIAIISTITLQAQTPQQGSLSGPLIDDRITIDHIQFLRRSRFRCCKFEFINSS